MKEKRCPKCGAMMVAGRVCDNAVGFWSEAGLSVSDSPQAIAPKGEGRGSPMYPIVTYRCAGCGYLEWYATVGRYATKTEV